MGLFLILLLAIVFIHQSYPLTINTYEIQDLETSSSSDFLAEAANWQATNIGSTKVTQCWNTWILQGYGLTKLNGYFTRTYTALPTHNSIRFSMKVYLIDLQPNVDMLAIYVDNVLIKTLDSNWFVQNSFPGWNMCGGSGKEYFGAYFGGLIAHSSSSLTLKVLSKWQNGNTFSYGIRDLNMLFQVTPSPATSVCSWVYPSTSGARSCFCFDGDYNPAGSSSCSGNCASACQTCNGPTANDCTSCKSGYSYTGTACASCGSLCSQCDGANLSNCIQCNSGAYLYWNGTCKSSCPSPLVTGSSSQNSLCNLPCPAAQFYYQNVTCKTTCTGSFTQVIQGDLKICNFICSGSNYLYSNGSCLTTCASPFISVVKGVERYCNSPCPAGQFWFENNSSCGSVCSNPYTSVTEGIITYCRFKCSTSQYYYSNSSCLSSCNSPFVITTEGTSKYCNSPCLAGEYWFMSNSSCGPYCESPYYPVTEGIMTYCLSQCLSTDYYYRNFSCLPSCSSPFSPATDGTNQYCNSPCPVGQYWFESNNSCGSSCNSPYYQVTEGSVDYCRFPCLTSQYYFGNASCLPSCSSPFTVVMDGTSRYCDSPCPVGKFRFASNNSCEAYCNSPFIQVTEGVLTYCRFPCLSSQYLYGNLSCLASCSSPYGITIQGANRYCNSPCAVGQYWFESNSSCETDCNAPYLQVTEGVLTYCRFSCLSSEYMYWNDSCMPSCPTSFRYTRNGNKYCSYYCEDGSYYYWNKTCISTCSSPLVKSSDSESYEFCNLPCASTEYWNIDTKKCVSSCDSTKIILENGMLQLCQPAESTFTEKVTSVIAGASAASNIIRSNNLNSAFMISLAKLLKYIQWINVPIPQDVRDTLSPNVTGGISITQMFSYSMPEGLQDKFTNHELPGLFSQSIDNSSYLVNHWDTISSYLFLIGLGIAATVFERFIQNTKYPRIILIVKRFRIVTRWNFFLYAFFNTYDDLTLFAILEFKTLTFDSACAIISFMVCIIVSLCAAGLFYRGVSVSWKAFQLQFKVSCKTDTEDKYVTFYKKWENYQVFYSGFKNDRLFSQSYLFVFTFRVFVCYLIVGFLYEYPLIQVFQLLLLSIVSLLYIIKYRPITDWFSEIVNLGYEVLILVANVTLTLLGLLSSFGHLSDSLQYKLGQVILINNMLANILSTIFSWGYLLTGLYSAYKISKKYGFKGKTAWIAGFLSPYSNPGMDFNEISYQNHEGGEGFIDRISPLRSPAKSSALRPMLTTAFSKFSINIIGNDSDYDSFAKGGGSTQGYPKRSSAVLSPSDGMSISNAQNESKLNFNDAWSPRESRRLGSSSRKGLRSNSLIRMQLESANSLSYKGTPVNRLLLSSEGSNLELPSLTSIPNKDGRKTSIVIEENFEQRRLNNPNRQESLMLSHNDVFTPSEFGFVSPANNDVNRSNNIRRRIRRTINNMTRTETLDQFSQPTQTVMEETNQSPFSGAEEESLNPFQELRDESMMSTPAGQKQDPKRRIEIRIKNISKSKAQN